MALGDQTKLLDLITFSSVPIPGEATLPNDTPFVISMSAGDTGDHYITLYSQYSRSRPYQRDQNNWNNLLPQWQFTDTDGNQLDKIKTNDTIITNANGDTIGVTGNAEFYYIDDMPTLDYSSPVMLWATLEVSGRPVDYDSPYSEFPGYANSKIVQGIPYYVNGQAPTHLTITKNGVDDINKLKWLDVSFRYTILLKSDSISTACFDVDPITVFNYPTPATDELAAISPINRTLVGVPASAQTWEPETAYFQRLDPESGVHTGGYQIGSVESSDQALNTQLSASVYISSTDVFRDTPYAWISNGESKTINRVSVPLDYGDGYENPFIPEVFQTSYSDDAFPVSAVSGEDFGGIFGIAVTPCYNVWTVDPEMDRLFKFDTDGTMLSSIDMPPPGSSPQSVALDSDSNLWITLYNSVSTVKYGLDGIQTSAIAIPPFSSPDNFFVRPVQVDTDTDDNIWVTYEHPASSMLVKYDTNGSYLLSASLPVSAQPFGLVIDPEDDSVWVSNSYEVIVSPYSWQNAASAGEIQHFSASGSLIETFDNIPRPSYLTLDSDSNLWFIFGYSGLGSISGSTVSQYFLSAGEIDVYGAPHIALDNSQDGLNSRMDGVAVDSRERVWALNSRENAAYVMPLESPLSANAITINPSNVSAIDRGIQAIGDWTGYQWILKYGGTEVGFISGVSNFISIDNFGEDLEMRKFNESWDAAQQMQDYAIPEHINNNPNLFDNYLYAMVGGLSAGEESIGRESYERIANFVPNHVDIDTCGIDQLYSLANELDVPIDDYQFSYPPALKRLINLVSISHQKLWGTRCRCRTNFKIGEQCSDCGHSHCLNRGRSRIDQSTYYVSGGVPFVVSPKFGIESYDVLIDTSFPASGVPLSATSSINWLASANYEEYHFYKYIPTLCDTQLEGVINWDDEYTTLSENNSSLSAWYDDCETVDIMLSQVLYEGLGLD